MKNITKKKNCSRTRKHEENDDAEHLMVDVKTETEETTITPPSQLQLKN
jgi:hypothetical protein